MPQMDAANLEGKRQQGTVYLLGLDFGCLCPITGSMRDDAIDFSTSREL